MFLGTSLTKNHFDTAVVFYSFVVGSAYVGTRLSIVTKQSKLFCLGLSSSLSFERVWVTQELLYISLEVVLDKTLKTNKRKFTIEHLILNILNLLSLILTKL